MTDPVATFGLSAAGRTDAKGGVPSWRLMLEHPSHWIAFGCGSGLVRPAPGTWGTLAAWFAFVALDPWFDETAWVVVIGLTALVGAWAAERTGRTLGQAGHGAIVIDEIVAFWLVLLVLPTSLTAQALGFLVFRLFDILCNPPPAGCPPDVRVPELDNQFDWTTFCLSTADCNVDSATVMDLIWGENVAETTVTIDDDIGPHNGGEQDTLCQNLAEAYPDLPAPLTVSTVVQNPDNPDNADLKAFWVFMLTDVDCRGLGQEISGYFVEQLWGVGVESTPLTIDPGAEPAQYGIFVANLVE